MAGAKRIEKFGDFVIVDNLVKQYSGVYSHDDILNLDVLMVHNLILYNRNLSYIESRKEEIQRKAELAKSK